MHPRDSFGEVEYRDPKQLTFVFPVDLTGSREAGLKDLRKDFSNVEIPEPWGASRLVEKLRDSPEVRQDHIDRMIGVDHQIVFWLNRINRALGATSTVCWWAGRQTVCELDGKLRAPVVRMAVNLGPLLWASLKYVGQI